MLREREREYIHNNEWKVFFSYLRLYCFFISINNAIYFCAPTYVVVIVFIASPTNNEVYLNTFATHCLYFSFAGIQRFLDGNLLGVHFSSFSTDFSPIKGCVAVAEPSCRPNDKSNIDNSSDALLFR